MDNCQELLVHLNYMGDWTKNSNSWVFDGNMSRMFTIHKDISYEELLEKIYNVTDTNKDECGISLTAWTCFPSQQVLPPSIICTDVDVTNYLKFNDSRSMMIPLCITKVVKVVKIIPNIPTNCLPSHSIHQSYEERDAEMNKGSDVGGNFSAAAGLDDINLVDSDNDINLREEDILSPNDVYDYRSFGQPYDPYFGVYHVTDEIPTSSNAPPSVTAQLVIPEHDTNMARDGNINGIGDIGVSTSSGTFKWSTTDCSNVHLFKDFFVGELIHSKQALIMRLRILCMRSKREFKISHSNSERLIVRCVDKNCLWRLRGSLEKTSAAWVIKKYDTEHTCSIDLRFKSSRGVATAAAVANCVASDYCGEETCLDPNNIKGNMNANGICISYHQAWRAKELAVSLLRGVPEDSFKGLPSYLWLLKQSNPGTYTSYEVESNNCFKSAFVAFGASVNGFRDCIRPVLAIDATFLKGKYRGKLFLATGQDANNQIFPLGFGVAATEDDESWGWFLEQLSLVIGQREDLVIVSDRHRAIEGNVRRVFPDALFGICMVHLGRNMKVRYKIKPENFLYKAALVYTVHEFNDVMNAVKVRNPEVFNYLMEADPRKWARCHFSGRRYGIMTTNIAECVNNVLKKARCYPIIGMFELIREKLQEWFHDRRRAAAKVTTILAKECEATISQRDDESRHFYVNAADENRFTVRDGYSDGTVDLQAMTCSCRVFQLDQLPCKHAIKSCRVRNISIYSLCSRFYTNATTILAYDIPILPVPHRSEWDTLVPNNVRSIEVHPPFVVNKSGRPKKKRIPSQGEEVSNLRGTRRRCGKCFGVGHNKATCTGTEYVAPRQ